MISQEHTVGGSADTMKTPVDGVLLTRIYRDMVRSRLLDECLVERTHAKQLAITWHSGRGEEALCAVYAQLREDDYAGYTHRGCYAWLAKGMPMRDIVAEACGKYTGCAKGKGGTHMVDMLRGIFGRSGMQGGHFPLLTGAAIAIQLRGSDQVAVCAFGEGCATSGMMHEAINHAAVWKLPVVYLAENNTCSETERTEQIWAQPDIARMGLAYNIPFWIAGDNDAVALAEAASEAIARARAGLGPSIVELKTFRIRGHSEHEPEALGYRTREEIAAWAEKDPIQLLQARLLAQGALTSDDVAQISQEAQAELEDAVRFAEESPLPPPEEAFTDIYGTLAYQGAR